MRKNLWFRLILLVVTQFAQPVLAQSGGELPLSAVTLTTGDSLLAAADYESAATVYEQLAGKQASPALLLRLAFAYEQLRRTPDALWALRRAYDVHPDRKVLRKMDALAAANRITGYEYGDRYYFYTLFRRYYPQLLEALLIVGVLGATILVLRRRRRPAARPWAGALLAYVGLAAVGVNLLRPEEVGREVIVQQPTPLMSEPGAGSRWLTTLAAGQQLPVMGQPEDIWLPVRWQRQRAWVRREALYRRAR